VKFWIEAIMEHGDNPQACDKCHREIIFNERLFCQFEMVSGGQPNADELHPSFTGKTYCSDCGKQSLI
jgi:hypothetical protein